MARKWHMVGLMSGWPVGSKPPAGMVLNFFRDASETRQETKLLFLFDKEADIASEMALKNWAVNYFLCLQNHEAEKRYLFVSPTR